MSADINLYHWLSRLIGSHTQGRGRRAPPERRSTPAFRRRLVHEEMERRITPSAFTSDNSTTFTGGTSGSFIFKTTGFDVNNHPPTITTPGTLPSGVHLVDFHNGTARLTGSPDYG